MRDSCCGRIWVGVAFTFIATTFVLVGVICYREFIFHKETEDTKITRENLIKFYPSIFSIDSSRYEQILLDGARKRTPTKERFQTENECSFNCNNTLTGPGRKKLETPPSNLHNHGCCRSFPVIQAPPFWDSISNGLREIVQFNDTNSGYPLLQIFFQEQCSQAIGCTGCTCEYVEQATTAVVYKALNWKTPPQLCSATEMSSCSFYKTDVITHPGDLS
ncbi:unnamed protein product [Mytilus edulis]|uniref:Uncharacterized protein n=1 Tax=Mytilus edulis TaxID=6550 RepID=A0A8S3TLH8_MYTED|nr:unnamed protein product [Mytilus edulis]